MRRLTSPRSASTRSVHFAPHRIVLPTSTRPRHAQHAAGIDRDDRAGDAAGVAGARREKHRPQARSAGSSAMRSGLPARSRSAMPGAANCERSSLPSDCRPRRSVIVPPGATPLTRTSGAKFDRQLADQPDHGMLRGGIKGAAAARIEAGDRRGEHHAARCFHQLRQGRLGAEDHALDVDPEQLVVGARQLLLRQGRRASHRRRRPRHCRRKRRAGQRRAPSRRRRACCRRAAATSPAMPTTLSPNSPRSCSARAATRSMTPTRAPSSIKRATTARPIPDPPPVTSATCPSSQPMSRSPRRSAPALLLFSATAVCALQYIHQTGRPMLAQQTRVAGDRRRDPGKPQHVPQGRLGRDHAGSPDPALPARR